MNSSILNSSDYYFRHLGNFLENAVGDNSHWLLCWRATLHGWNVNQFHSRCDGKKDSVTIIRKGQFIFGGYADIPWGKKKLIPLFNRPFLLQCNSFTIIKLFFYKVETSLLVCHLVMMVKCFCVMNLVTFASVGLILNRSGRPYF